MNVNDLSEPNIPASLATHVTQATDLSHQDLGTCKEDPRASNVWDVIDDPSRFSLASLETDVSLAPPLPSFHNHSHNSFNSIRSNTNTNSNSHAIQVSDPELRASLSILPSLVQDKDAHNSELNSNNNNNMEGTHLEDIIEVAIMEYDEGEDNGDEDETDENHIMGVNVRTSAASDIEPLPDIPECNESKDEASQNGDASEAVDGSDGDSNSGADKGVVSDLPEAILDPTATTNAGEAITSIRSASNPNTPVSLPRSNPSLPSSPASSPLSSPLRGPISTLPLRQMSMGSHVSVNLNASPLNSARSSPIISNFFGSNTAQASTTLLVLSRQGSNLSSGSGKFVPAIQPQQSSLAPVRQSDELDNARSSASTVDHSEGIHAVPQTTTTPPSTTHTSTGTRTAAVHNIFNEHADADVDLTIPVMQSRHFTRAVEECDNLEEDHDSAHFSRPFHARSSLSSYASNRLSYIQGMFRRSGGPAKTISIFTSTWNVGNRCGEKRVLFTSTGTDFFIYFF
jgi:hypothetical protein